jgi:urease accessory protein
MVLRAASHRHVNLATEKPWRSIVLDSHDRHLRRKMIFLGGGEEVLVDFEKPVHLAHGDCLVLDDGRLIEVIAGEEDLMEVRAVHLAAIAWHIGNRHLEAQIEETRILIRPDHVIAGMLEHLGAKVKLVREAFAPEHGAYHSHEH